MQNKYGTSGKIMAELGRAGINISLINQPVSEMTIIVGVHNQDLQKTIRVIYEVFTQSRS
jgi:aspartate kinase